MLSMLKIFWLAVFFLVSYCISGQEKCSTFELDGIMVKGSRTMCLTGIGDARYYPHLNYQTAQVTDQKFSFTDSIEYPTAYILGNKEGEGKKWEYLSDIFFIDPCHQTVICFRDSNQNTPDITNETMKEWTGDYQKWMARANREIDRVFDSQDSLYQAYNHRIPKEVMAKLTSGLEKAKNKRNTALLLYARAHPGSYVVLWQLIELLPGGYYPLYDSVFNQLSPHVKNTFAGVQLYKNLHATKSITIGQRFPQLHLVDSSFMAHDVPAGNQANKYTLINFWNSNSFPCLRQFPAYRKLYADYKKYGFEILAVSIDDTASLPNWKKTIVSQKLAYPQFLDRGGRNATQLCIDYFPTNFLLDEKGVIVKRNIQPDELEKILQGLKDSGN